MSAILKSDMSFINAQNFVDSIYNGDSVYYVSVGRDEEWSNEDVPPTPTDTIEDENDFRDHIIGVKRVMVTDCAFIVSRIEWEAEKEFKLVDETLSLAYRAENYYCVNRYNMVYKCIGIPSEGAKTQEGCEPIAKGKEIATLDGFTWQYLYTIPTTMIVDGLLLDTLMPVPFSRRGSFMEGTLTDEDQKIYGDLEAARHLGAYRVIISLKLEDEGTAIPYTTTYRQVGMFHDLQNVSGEYIEGENYSAENFDIYSGNMVYFENRRLVNREVGQSEIVQIIMLF